MFFFEKKNQKTFVSRSVNLREHQELKSFASFLQKRRPFLAFSEAHPAAYA